MRTRPITVAETTAFIRQAAGIWTERDRAEFVDFIARNPEAGDLIPQSGGVRKREKGRGPRDLFLPRPRYADLPADDLHEGTA